MSIASRVSGLIFLLKNATFYYRMPGKAVVLIYDRLGKDNFLLYLDESKTETLDVRFESLNIPIASIALLKTLFSRNKGFFQLYIESFIESVDPRIVVTFIDNNMRFWSLKKDFSNCIFIFIQNGVRGIIGDVFDHLINGNVKTKKEFEVDHMLVFGQCAASLYKKFIKGKTHNIGSFKNNLFRNKKQNEHDLIFVLPFSQNGSDKKYRYKTVMGEKITWDDCYKYNKKILNFLVKYCDGNKLKLTILGRSKNIKVQEVEKKYINDLVNQELDYLPNSSLYSSYDALNSTKYTVVIESTLGHEALARGKRVACLAVREHTLGESSRFGSPDLPHTGPFWTNQYTEEEFERVMDFVIKSSDNDWTNICQQYIPELIEYDPGNIQFLALMRELKAPLKLEYQV